MQKQIHAWFSGSVQGVGFRYTARRIAAQYNVHGWVKNLPDGRVELVAEGNEDTLRQMLEAIQETFDGYIGDTDVLWSEPHGEAVGFSIKF